MAMTIGRTRSRNRTSLPRAGLALFLVLAFGSAGITALPGAALGADSHKAKKKADKKERVSPQELQARADFAAGRYAEALDAFAKLYAETLHPTYLRNVGRCYQNMNQYERAASSFRDYLRKAKDLSADERKEVEGFIDDMDRAKKKEQEDAAAAALAAKPVVAPPPPAATLVTPPAPPPPAPAPGPAPFYTKAWFWGVVGGVVAAGVVGGLWAGGVFSSKSNCVSGYTCPSN
jgi:hypothetical protein